MLKLIDIPSCCVLMNLKKAKIWLVCNLWICLLQMETVLYLVYRYSWIDNTQQIGVIPGYLKWMQLHQCHFSHLLRSWYNLLCTEMWECVLSSSEQYWTCKCKTCSIPLSRVLLIYLNQTGGIGTCCLSQAKHFN